MIEAKFRQFMYGRYGTDQFNIFLMIVYILICIVNFFVGSKILWFIGLAVFIYQLFRTFSKHITARQKENAVFLKIKTPVFRFFGKYITRFRERKSFRYRKCPKCKATLRLPYRKGKHIAKCPKCGNTFEVRIL